MKGIIFQGSLEEVMRSKKQFIENSIAFAVKLQERYNDQTKVKTANIDIMKDKSIKTEKETSTETKSVKMHYCRECDFVDANKRVLKTHVFREHSHLDEVKKQCKFCLQEFKILNDTEMDPKYRTHLEKFHIKQDLSEFQDAFNKMEYLTCSSCEKNIFASQSISALSALNQHVRKVHIDNKIEEVDHVENNVHENSLQEGIESKENVVKVKEEEDQLLNDKENKVEDDKTSAGKNMKRNEAIDISKPSKSSKMLRLYACKDCDFKDTNHKVLKIHIKHVHGQADKPYRKCKYCTDEFQMRNDETMNPRYRNHLEKTHPKQDLSEFTEDFNKMDFLICSFCHKTIYGHNLKSTLNLLNSHIRQVHDENEKNESNCPECNKTVKSNYLERHIEITHRNARFTCEECGKSFKNKQQLKCHVKMHTAVENDELSKCEVCDNFIPPNTSLQRHMYRKHGGRKFNPVTCDECGKQLGDRSKLKNHKDSIHLKIKAFQCDICMLSVSRLDNLKQHKQRVHKI